MNYLLSFLVCLLLTSCTATPENLRTLQACDLNVAAFLALAWFLGR